MKAVCAAACVGIAAWCSFGALGIAGDSSVSARIALLPPWWLIAVLIGAAWIVVRVLRLSPAELSPLFTSALLILPWLPIPLPAAALLWTCETALDCRSHACAHCCSDDLSRPLRVHRVVVVTAFACRR
jgi:hypothetical protein